MYSSTQIQQVLKSTIDLTNSELRVSHILTDSRKLTNPDSTLFFALTGDRLNGHNYIAELYEKGVRNFVVETLPNNAFKDANYYLVQNSRNALQVLAAFHREQFKLPVIGVTGSNGKTIIKEWCHQLLQEDYHICRSPKSYNSQIGVPISVWNLRKKDNLAIFEAGISEPGEMERLEKIIQPTIGIFSNIGSAHGANFIRDEHKVREKLKLFVRSEVLIFCTDHPIVNQTIKALWGNSKEEGTRAPELLTWGSTDDATLQITNSDNDGQNTLIKTSYKNQQLSFEVPFTDASSIENSMHLVLLMLHLQYSEELINQRLKGLQRIAMRLEQKSGVNNCLIINDSYNSDIDSLKIALDFLAQQQKQPKKTVILSDILQSGMPSVDLYQSVVNLIIQSGVDKFIGIGPALTKHKFLFKDFDEQKECSFYESTVAFLQDVQDIHFKDEAILLKGARTFVFEKISHFLEEKAHSTLLEINLNSVLHNFRFFSSLLREETKIMVMVKAFSYGAGSFEIAKLLEFHRVDYLGVAYADEGVQLRKAGIKTPIMVLNPEKRSFEALLRYQLEPEVYSFTLLNQLNQLLRETKHENPLPIHLNFDTGMKRLGFEIADADELIEYLKANNQFEVKGIFSHLAASDEKAWDEFTKEQIAAFEEVSQKLSKALNISPIRHIANSYGITRFPEAQYDMVRLGLGLYGVNNQFAKELLPVGTLKSTISQIKNVPKGVTIGYGRVGVAKKDIRIATIAIGYADGMNRLQSNGKGYVFLHNQRAPIIGNVCMDMTMIDVTDIPQAKEGDMVEIFGENISVNEIAAQIGTISYEVLTSVSERVKRVYFMD